MALMPGEQLTDAQRNSVPLLQALRQLFAGAAAEKYSAILEDEGFENLHDVSFATVELLEGVGFIAADANSLWEAATTGKIKAPAAAPVEPAQSEPPPSAEAAAAGRGRATDATPSTASSSSGGGSSQIPAVPVVVKAAGGAGGASGESGAGLGAGLGEGGSGGPGTAAAGAAAAAAAGAAAAAAAGAAAAAAWGGGGAAAAESDLPITHGEIVSLLADHISVADAKRASSQKEDLMARRHVRSPRKAPHDPWCVLAPTEHGDPPLATCLGWLRYPGEATQRFCVFDSWRDLAKWQSRAKCVVLASQKISAYRSKARVLGAWMVYAKAVRHAMLAAQKIESSDEFFTAASRNAGKIAIQQQQT